MQLSLKKIFYLLITIFIILFIFYNSIQNGENSSETSTLVLNFINNMINVIGLSFKLDGYFIRKLAHFVEFFAFGLFLMLSFKEFTNKTFSIISFPMFFALLVPVIDEFIQIYSPGRASSVKDVLLDFSGAITGIIIVCLCSKIKKRRKYKYKLKF